MKRCNECGFQNLDDCVSCRICGATLNTNQNYQYNTDNPSQNHQQENLYYTSPCSNQPTAVKKKKGHGCLITLSVFGAIILLLSFIALSNSSTDESNNSNSATNFVFDNKVIYDENNIRIEAVSSSITSSEATIDLYIENNSDKDRTIYVNKYAINGIMIDNVYSSSISSDSLSFSSLILDTEILPAKSQIVL